MSAWIPSHVEPVLVLLFVLAVVGILGVALYAVPNLLVDGNGLSSDVKATTETSVRTAVLQSAAGIALFVGLYYTSRTARSNRQGQAADRFSKAVEQLGSESTDVRIGAIIAFEHLARESKELRVPITDLLARFVNGRCSRADLSSEGKAEPIAADVDMAIRVLGRRTGRSAETTRIDFYERCLVKARLDAGDLRGVIVSYGQLDGAAMIESDLRGANFFGASVRDAFLSGSDLREASFHGAKLNGTFLPGADARNASFVHADLSSADFSYRRSKEKVRSKGARLAGAHLNHAQTDGTDFRGVDLRKVIGLSQTQINVAITNEDTLLPPGLETPTGGLSGPPS